MIRQESVKSQLKKGEFKMRSAGSLVVMVLAATLAASAQAVVIVSVVPDQQTLTVGEQTQVRVLAQGTAAGIGSLGGSIVADGDDSLEAVAGSFAFVPQFQSWSAASPVLAPVLGSAGPNGGWASFGSMQTALPPDSAFGKAAAVELASYTVQAVAPGQVTLAFQAGEVQGYLPAETDAGHSLGTLSAAQITVLVPEPASLLLLALTGAGLLRRRPRG